MKINTPLIIFFFILISLTFSSHRNQFSSGLLFAKNSSPRPQDVPEKKPKYDYMSTFLSRNTRPLGLKEDLALKKLLEEPAIKWAIRAGKRHILD